MHFNHGRVITIKEKNEEEINSMDNFKYLGGWLESSAIRLWRGQLITG